MKNRIFSPLGMKDTDFYVPLEKLNRFTTIYGANPEAALQVTDRPDHSSYSVDFSEAWFDK